MFIKLTQPLFFLIPAPHLAKACGTPLWCRHNLIASALDQRCKCCAVSNDFFSIQDLFCGVLDGEHVGLVTSIERTMEFVFMEALAFPAADTEDDDANCPTVKNQLLPGLRSFCSALRG
jgi:hypothetical protein